MALSSIKPWLFKDKNHLVITSQERVDQLIRAGLTFEACAVQTVVVEALLYLTIQLLAIFERPMETEKIKKNLNELTLGQLVRRAINFTLLDESLVSKLVDYKDKRNFLIHQYLTTDEGIDYQRALEQGRELTEIMYTEIRKYIHNWLEKTNPPEANQWT